MSQPRRKFSTARKTGLKSSVMLPLVVTTMVRWITAMMATGHSAERKTVAVLGAPVWGPKVACAHPRTPPRGESTEVMTAAPPGLSDRTALLIVVGAHHERTVHGRSPQRS